MISSVNVSFPNNFCVKCDAFKLGCSIASHQTKRIESKQGYGSLVKMLIVAATVVVSAAAVKAATTQNINKNNSNTNKIKTEKSFPFFCYSKLNYN